MKEKGNGKKKRSNKFLIKEAIETLALPEGGLILSAECGPDVPLKNIEAICQIFEKYGCKRT